MQNFIMELYRKKQKEEGISFPSLYHLISEIPRELSQVQRWDKYVALGSRPESVLHHTVSALLIADIVLHTLEQKKSTHSLSYNPFQIMSCVLLHDFGEIETGDITYILKTDEQDKSERGYLVRRLNSLPQYLRNKLIEDYDIQKGNDDSNLIFEFIERMGYLVYALTEFERNKRNHILLLQVSRNQLPRIRAILKDIPCLKEVFDDQLTESLDNLISINEGMYIES